MRKIKILVGIFFTLAVLNTFCSCIMDMKEAPFRIKNETNDTLLIDLSESDTLADWIFWSELDDISPNDTSNIDIAFTKAIIGHLALPNTYIDVAPNVYRFKDTCYIYAVEWNIAKRYSMGKIRSRKLYKRQAVTQTYFYNRQYIYRDMDSVTTYKIPAKSMAFLGSGGRSNN